MATSTVTLDKSRTLYNMTAAMSGQKLATPEDEAIGQKGKEAGFKAAALTTATGALAGPLAAPAVATEQVGTGILDATGQEIFRETMKYGPSVARTVLSHPLAQQLLKYAVLRLLGVFGE